MPQPSLNNSVTNAKQRFWARQFQAQTTGRQIAFDWIFGVGLPVICFVFDPIVFKNSNFGGALLGNYKTFAYLLSFISIVAMATWLVCGARLKWLNAFCAGLFITGAVISFVIGAILFPFSLAGLFILIGALGFTPLLTGLVYFRNGLRALQMAKPFFSEKLLTVVFLLTVIFSAVVPYAINAEIRKILEEIKNADLQTIRINARKLKFFAPLIDFDVLARRYYQFARENKESEDAQAIAEVYRDLTGENVEANWWLAD